jgi:hypothetical protein
LSWILNTTFMAWKNSYNTKCILMDLIIKDSNQCRYWDVWTNLYKPHEYSQALQTKTLCFYSPLWASTSMSNVAQIICSHENFQSNDNRHIVPSKNVNTKWSMWP